jgi:hypothetical protein
MKRMRITGESKDGKMLEHVREVLQFLGFDIEGIHTPNFPNVFLIGIYQDGRLYIDQEHDNVNWSKARQAVILVFHKDTNRWTIRHISEDYKIHKQYIGRKGYRICINDWEKRELLLYNNKKICIGCELNDDKEIIQGIKDVWSTYLRELLGDNTVKVRLLS